MSRARFFPGGAEEAAGERELLRAVRDLIQADRSMRRDAGRRMSMGETDLRALRFVMASTSAGRSATPHDLAQHLGITTAATTTVLDRLAAAGHVQRRPHPSDRRSKVLVATEHAYDEARSTLSGAHDLMQAAAARVPVEARPAVVAFLQELTEAMARSAAGED